MLPLAPSLDPTPCVSSCYKTSLLVVVSRHTVPLSTAPGRRCPTNIYVGFLQST